MDQEVKGSWGAVILNSSSRGGVRASHLDSVCLDILLALAAIVVEQNLVVIVPPWPEADAPCTPGFDLIISLLKVVSLGHCGRIRP